MTRLEVRPADGWSRPLPALDNVSATFWSAAAEGRLLIQRCPQCGTRQFYPRAMCTTCGTETEWEEASGRGTVYTYTVIRQNGSQPFRSELPYVVAMIALEEGPRMMGNVTGCPIDQVVIGMAVQAYIATAEPGTGVPFWEPAR